MITLIAEIKLESGEIITIDRKNLLNIELTTADRSDFRLPSFGIISNTCNISFADTNKNIKIYAQNLKLKSGLTVNIYLYNTIRKTKKQMGVYSTKTWNYDENSNVSVSLKDDLENWQDIYRDALCYDYENVVSMTAKELYEYLQSTTPIRYKMLSFNDLDEKTKTFLSKISVKFPLIKAGTLWSQWQKFCEAFQVYIYKNDLGETVCRYDGGN